MGGTWVDGWIENSEEYRNRVGNEEGKMGLGKKSVAMGCILKK